MQAKHHKVSENENPCLHGDFSLFCRFVRIIGMSTVYREAPNLRREIIAFLKEKIDPDFIIVRFVCKRYARPDSDVDIAFTKKAVYWHPMNVFYLPRNLQID